MVKMKDALLTSQAPNSVLQGTAAYSTAVSGSVLLPSSCSDPEINNLVPVIGMTQRRE